MKMFNRKGERRGFFVSLGRAIEAREQFEYLNHLSDESLARMNLTRDQIPQYIAKRL